MGACVSGEWRCALLLCFPMGLMRGPPVWLFSSSGEPCNFSDGSLGEEWGGGVGGRDGE